VAKNKIKNNSESAETSPKQGVSKKKIWGIVLALVSAYLFMAILSYLFTWKHDQAILSESFMEYYFTGDSVVDNYLGKLGASLAHKLVYLYLGLASLFVPVLLGFSALFLLGVKFEKTISRFALDITCCTLWLSVFLGAVIAEPVAPWAGAVGYGLSNWLGHILGTFGLFLFLIGTLVLLLLLIFKVEAKTLAMPFVWLYEKIFHKQVALVQKEAKQIDVSESTETLEELLDYQTPEEPADEDDAEIPDFSVLEEKVIKPEQDFVVNIPKGDDLVSENAQNLVEQFGEYDPTLDLSSYQMPSLDLLKSYPVENQVTKDELNANKQKIIQTLAHYNIPIKEISATVGPTITLYEIVPSPGIRISKIKSLEDDIALNLAALGIRIIAPMPGKGTVGIEVPNEKPQMVPMRILLASEKFQHGQMELPLVLGKTISNETCVVDLTKMPHLLIAGATGQGKSVGINAIIMSLLYKKHPSQLKFVFVDPKKVELSLYSKIERHYLAKLPGQDDAIITDTSKVVKTLSSLCKEMDIRYELLKDAQCKNIKEYNTKFVNRKLSPENGHRYLPYIVLVIDEFADLIMTAGKEVETPIARLAQLARAIGIHLIVATQRPSVNVITGVIKANFPARIAFRVMSQVDSKTILDTQGADRLIGRGDLLFSSGQEPQRLQCGFVDTPEVEDVVDFIAHQRGYADAYLLPEADDANEGGADFDAGERDSKFEEAARIVVATQQGSTSLIQRKLKLGYNRAGRIMDQLEATGIVGPFEGSKSRRVLVPDENALERLLSTGTM